MGFYLIRRQIIKVSLNMGAMESNMVYSLIFKNFQSKKQGRCHIGVHLILFPYRSL
jgi:hypothetical protein